jgi:hypothetical protein
LADAELHSGHVAKAQACVQEALLLDPQHAGSRLLMARLAAAPPPRSPAPPASPSGAQRF